MAKSLPHITVSVGRQSDDAETTSDINLLSVGLGLYQAWMYLSVFGSGVIFMATKSPSLGEAIYASSFATQVFDAYFITVSLCLLLVAFANQLLLRFFTSKSVLLCATVVAVAGSILAFMPAGEESAWLMAVGAGVCMGLGSSLMIVLWGTAFARYEFTTIILNTAIALAIGVIVYFTFIQWMRTAFSCVIAAICLVISALLLWRLAPMRSSANDEIPVFRPLPVQRSRFTMRVGVPTLLFGVVLGMLLFICIERVLANTRLSEQVIVGAAAIVSMGLIFMVSALISHEEAHWDMIFRILVPIVGLSLVAVPYLSGQWSLLAEFLVICGYICMQTLMWIFFSNLAQEFRLSPIFVFGLGNCIVSVGTIAGAYLGRVILEGLMTQSMSFIDIGVPITVGDLVLILLFALLLGYALLPRRREIRAIIVQGHALDASSSTAMDGDDGMDGNGIEGLPAISATENDDASPDGGRASIAMPVAAAPAPNATTTPEQDHATLAPEQAEAASSDHQVTVKRRFRDACEELADRYLLSRRESEVMFLLAKGHNASYIQDKLCISRSTAKTHINHIYKKLDIHTQQELLNMVDETMDEAHSEEPSTTA